MQSFSTKDVRHEFEVDGIAYYLPGVTVEDYEAVAALGRLEETQMISAFRDLLASRVEPQRRTIAQWFMGARSARQAVNALNIKQLSELFREWSGMGKPLGESSASPVPQ